MRLRAEIEHKKGEEMGRGEERRGEERRGEEKRGTPNVMSA
ncbi:rCG42089 [Rattus norvegicus]|uniref:RCG42089 n=1 Tax=Rattus norvegicus TaxID=10116 RepID=A6JUS0_RAT|nr:rCG42089 [Rattus norvegicus]